MSLCTERSPFPGMTLYTERSLDESVYREESVNGKVFVGTERNLSSQGVENGN
jgi:hypothetical protein